MSDTLDPHGETAVAGVGNGATAQQVDTAPEIKVSEDGNQITRGDRTYLPAEAVKQERAARQQLQAQLQQLEPLLPEFQEWLQNKQSGRQAAVTRATEGADGPYTKDELTAIAELNRYYTEDGQSLDLDRAKQALDIMSRVGERSARGLVEPVARTTMADRAARNRQEAISRQYLDGAPIAEAAFVQQAFDALPPELAADPGVANLVQVIAAGMEYLDKRKSGKARAGREPQFTEGATGRFDGNGGRGLSAFAQRAAQARGYTPEQWAKLIEKPTPDARADRDGGFVLETGL